MDGWLHDYHMHVWWELVWSAALPHRSCHFLKNVLVGNHVQGGVSEWQIQENRRFAYMFSSLKSAAYPFALLQFCSLHLYIGFQGCLIITWQITCTNAFLRGYAKSGGTTGSKGHQLILLARLILALVKVFSRASHDLETSPIDLGGCPLFSHISFLLRNFN